MGPRLRTGETPAASWAGTGTGSDPDPVERDQSTNISSQ